MGMIARLVPAAVFKTVGIYTIDPVSSILTRSRNKEFPVCRQARIPSKTFAVPEGSRWGVPQMYRYLITISLILFSCEQPDLHHTTAASIHKTIASDKANHAVLLNVWATWCEPCVTEFPMIVDLAKEHENDLAVYFVSVDWPDEEAKVVSFLKKQGVDWITFIKNEKDNAFINGIHAEWSGALPFTILYGKTSGKVVDFWEGEQSEKRFKNAVNKAINS